MDISQEKGATFKSHVIKICGEVYSWGSTLEKIELIRTGIPYDGIQVFANNIKIDVTHLLELMEMPITKFKDGLRQNSLLNKRHSELLMEWVEGYTYGLVVFNNEEDKFLRWLTKRNRYLGDVTPIILFDTLTGISMVRNTLGRIDYGVFS